MLAHCLGLFAVSEWANLDVEELVLRLLADVDLIAALLECSEEAVGVLTM
jgi:hypothetical protein